MQKTISWVVNRLKSCNICLPHQMIQVDGSQQQGGGGQVVYHWAGGGWLVWVIRKYWFLSSAKQRVSSISALVGSGHEMIILRYFS